MAYTTPQVFEKWLRRPIPLSPSESEWVDVALDLAAILIRHNVDMTEADADRLKVAQWVSCEIVGGAFAIAWNRAGLRSWSETTGAIVESITVDNPSAALNFTETHLRMFGIKPASAPQYYFGDC